MPEADEQLGMRERSPANRGRTDKYASTKESLLIKFTAPLLQSILQLMYIKQTFFFLHTTSAIVQP